MAMVTTPSVMYMSRQPFQNRPSCGTPWNANDKRPPQIWPTPGAECQTAKRGACSDLVYHCVVMSISDGVMVASARERKPRAVIMPAQLVTSDVQTVMSPHTSTQLESHLDAGRRWTM